MVILVIMRHMEDMKRTITIMIMESEVVTATRIMDMMTMMTMEVMEQLTLRWRVGNYNGGYQHMPAHWL